MSSIWLSVAIASAVPAPTQSGESKSVARIRRDSPTTPNLPRVSQSDRPITSAQMLGKSPAPATVPTPPIVQVTAVKANPTSTGVEVILQTPLGEALQPTAFVLGRTYIANIPNAQLRLPSGEAFVFRSSKPIAGIAQIVAINSDANTIWVTVTGEAGVPAIELFDSPQSGLIFDVASATASSLPQRSPQTPGETEPGSETQPDSPAAEEEEIEILVTGDREVEGYSVPDASTATRTDTPVRDIPQSIQVVPQEVIEDQQITRISDAVRNVSGVSPLTDFSGSFDSYTIRGFDRASILRNGFKTQPSFIYGANIERVEVLKGSASVLYGQFEPGDIVNYVTK